MKKLFLLISLYCLLAPAAYSQIVQQGPIEETTAACNSLAPMWGLARTQQGFISKTLVLDYHGIRDAVSSTRIHSAWTPSAGYDKDEIP